MALDLSRPLDCGPRYRGVAPAALAALRDLQGNILRPHGCRCTAHLVLEFDAAQRARARSWVAGLAARLVSAKRQDEQAAARSGEAFVAFWLSAAGFRTLGLESALPADDAFRDGMSQRRSLGDPDAAGWEGHLKCPHALLLIAADSDAAIDREIAALLPAGMRDCVVARDERGQDIIRGGERFEPFGFREGLSNPSMVGRSSGWSPTDPRSDLFPLSQVLVAYPAGAAAYGSFFVFRKLQQDVARFEANVAALANRLATPDPEYAAALVIGRFRDGTLLVDRGGAGGRRTTSPGFTYDELDRMGSKCPFQAHIRRANPRSETGVAQERSRLIVRRGMPYRQQADSGAGGQTGTQGTLFVCCQSDIARQFETVQRDWLNARAGRLRDALAATNAGTEQSWPTAWGQDAQVAFAFQSCVTLRGGGYFFAPPISFLGGLASA